MTRDEPIPSPGRIPSLLKPGLLALALILPAAAHAAPTGEEGQGDRKPSMSMDMSGKSVIDKKAALDASQAVVGSKLDLGEYSFRSREGERVQLSRFDGKPLVISLIYTSCYHICPMTTKNLAEAIEQARGYLGKDAFSVVTIGFDTENDTPEAMRAFARKQGVASRANWWFLSGTEKTVKDLTSDLGFLFAPSPNGYDHMVQTTVLNGKGEIYRQVYGKAFAPPRLVRPLKELVLGSTKGSLSLSGIADNIRFFCTTYDPASGSYRFDYGFFLRVFLVLLVLVGVVVFLAREIRKSRNASRL